MSGRYKDYKGSSRSARDDSRLHRERERSRSPQRRSPSHPLPAPSRSRYSSSPSPPRPPRIDSRDKQQKSRNNGKDSKNADNWDSSEDEEVPAPPPPPRISKISIGFSKPKAPIKMNLGMPVKEAPKKPTVASVFNADDDDDEPEEMPAEAKMRMRNIGRETPTSAGPNSFGKTKQGFCDAKKVFEKNLKHALETVDGRKVVPKFPQTIYKISGGST